MSVAADVRDGVLTDFNAAGLAYFGVAFTATARWWDRSDQTTTGLVVSVIPDGYRKERLTRDRQRIEVDVIIHVVKKLSGDDVAEVDALFELVERCDRFYFETAKVSTIAATLQASSVQLPTRKQLNASRRFYAWVRLTFSLVNAN